MFAMLMANMFLLPVFMQELLGFTATQSGFALMPRTLVMMVDDADRRAPLQPRAAAHRDRDRRDVRVYGALVLSHSRSEQPSAT